MIATVENAAESAAVKMPPSERDFQVFRFVRVELHSTRAAAEVFGISQTRVRQVVSRVVEYLLATAREGLEEDEQEPAGSLTVAQQIARMQLEHLYQKAMEAWHKSQEANGFGMASLGQTKYLSLAARIALALAKVPMHAPPRTREEELEDEGEREVYAPPVEDCSPLAVSRSAPPVASQPAGDANTSAAASYKSLDEIKAHVRRSFLRPAQTEPALADESPESGEPSISESKRPLTRRERRARERELERLRKKR
jgi:hypothetical protein